MKRKPFNWNYETSHRLGESLVRENRMSDISLRDLRFEDERSILPVRARGIVRKEQRNA